MARIQYYALAFIFFIGFSAFMSGCHGAFDPDHTITVSGQVTDQSTNLPVNNASVGITNPPQFAQSTTTDSTGRFNFELESKTQVSLSIEAAKKNYQILNRTIDAQSGSDVTGITLSLSQNDTTQNGESNNEDSNTVGAAAIILSKKPANFININETGDAVSAPLTFQVQDSLGRPLTAGNAVKVKFSLVNSPGGGESLVPKEVTTNAAGNATTILFSGNKAGEVKLQALVERPEVGLNIKSSPVLIAIHGGFPDKNHFSVAANKQNFEGFDKNNVRNSISVVLGDKFSNPVKPGTVVYFETTGGIIQGSGTTDENGIVQVDLISGNPRAADGHATVTASTVNEENDRIQGTVDVIFSTSDAKITADPTDFNIPANEGMQFSYTITDRNGNPMPAGTQISIDAGQGIDLTGDTNFILGDFLEPGPNRTEFSFSARDTDNENNEASDLTIRISVTTPSGNTTTYSGIQGVRH